MNTQLVCAMTVGGGSNLVSLGRGGREKQVAVLARCVKLGSCRPGKGSYWRGRVMLARSARQLLAGWRNSGLYRGVITGPGLGEKD